MSASEQRVGRRREALSAASIVQAAIEILDADGEDALTFRLLAERLSTGAGAIYHHVGNKDELLEAAATELVAGAAVLPRSRPKSKESPRAFLLEMFDLIDAHPWLGAQLARAPWQTPVMLVFERVGERLEAIGVPARDHFAVSSALVHFLLGSAAQYAATSRVLVDTDRDTMLREVVSGWLEFGDRDEFPFVHGLAEKLADHDDRWQFAAGVDLILGGAVTLAAADPHR